MGQVAMRARCVLILLLGVSVACRSKESRQAEADPTPKDKCGTLIATLKKCGVVRRTVPDDGMLAQCHEAEGNGDPTGIGLQIDCAMQNGQSCDVFRECLKKLETAAESTDSAAKRDLEAWIATTLTLIESAQRGSASSTDLLLAQAKGVKLLEVELPANAPVAAQKALLESQQRALEVMSTLNTLSQPGR
jgi:hypothetical protein